MGIERAIFQSFIPEWVRLGFSMNKMIKEARRRKIPTYRRGVMLDDIRLAQDRSIFSSKVVDFPDTKKPTQRIMLEHKLHKPRRYRLTGHFKARDVETGRVHTEIVNFYSDNINTKEGWVDEYMDSMSESKVARYKIYEGGELLSIEHFRGMPH